MTARLYSGQRCDTPRKTEIPKLNSGMFSSASDEWETPRELFDAIDAVFHFTLDVCATSANAKYERYFTKAENGLTQQWSLLDEPTVWP